MNRIRVATLQYFVRPIRNFSEFRDQVKSLVRTAADYECRLVVFPEFFTVQLLTLGDIDRPMVDQIRSLADRADEFVDLMSGLAREHGIYIASGTIPIRDPKRPEKVYNDCFFFAPDGRYETQGKMHMTRFEKEVWKVSPRKQLKVFETEFGRVAIAICYDAEFPEVARAAARQGALILIVPSFTDDRQAFLRVRYCAQARAIENQMFVIQSSTVGSLPMVPAVSLNYGQASILTPSDFPFARDGILAEGVPNQESMVIGELNLRVLRTSRKHGAVVPLKDSMKTIDLAPQTSIVQLLHAAPPLKAPVDAPRIKRAKPRLTVRHVQEEDFRGIRELARLIYPDITPWGDDQLGNHLRVFPQGQLVAVDDETGLIVGMCSGLIIDWDHYEPEMDWSSFTSGGMYSNHDPVGGATLFAADVMVRPGFQGHGIGKRLYQRGRFGLAKQLGLRRILAGSRLRGYHRYSSTMSPQDYVSDVVRGKLNDPTLSFQLSQGFHVLTVVGNYFVGDPESLGWAAVIEWLNPDVADDEDYDQGDARYRVEPSPQTDGQRK
ncbi:MAG: GNAT family N-acetyltransferase [Planctomycetes bacterium]|nr:GNAT family N-acetyltransferase [Planctomycetota bacterium]